MSSKIATDPMISPFESVNGAAVEETSILEPSDLSINASSLTIFFRSEHDSQEAS
jgi:hypothetical protein